MRRIGVRPAARARQQSSHIAWFAFIVARRRSTSRKGLAAQRLRVKAALVLEWFGLCPRHGWLGNHSRRNPHGPIIVTGLGIARAAAVLAARQRRGLIFPYGRKAIRLGLAPPPS